MYLGEQDTGKAVSVVVLSATTYSSEMPIAGTINTGNMLIEEDALMQESLRFENEPWTVSTWPVKSFENRGARLENKESTRARATWLIRTK